MYVTPADRLAEDGSQRALAVAGERLPLAARRGTRYQSVSVELVPGDRLVMLTDGLAERRQASGELLGYEALADLFPSDESEPAGWIEALFRRVEDEGESSPEDDWTALLLEVTAPEAGLEPAGIQDRFGAEPPRPH